MIEIIENMGDDSAIANAYRVRGEEYSKDSGKWKDWYNKLKSLS